MLRLVQKLHFQIVQLERLTVKNLQLKLVITTFENPQPTNENTIS